MKGMKKRNNKADHGRVWGSAQIREKSGGLYPGPHGGRRGGRPLTGWRRRRTSSQPTVLRMLRALGFTGYKDFKYRLVAELASAEPEKARSAVPM